MPTVQALLAASTGGDATSESEIVSHGNRAKSWYTASAENVGSEARRVGMLGGHTRVSKSADDGEVGACWDYCTRHVTGIKKNLGRNHLKLSKRQRAFGRKK